jgi:hypothetical protein
LLNPVARVQVPVNTECLVLYQSSQSHLEKWNHIRIKVDSECTGCFRALLKAAFSVAQRGMPCEGTIVHVCKYSGQYLAVTNTYSYTVTEQLSSGSTAIGLLENHRAELRVANRASQPQASIGSQGLSERIVAGVSGGEAAADRHR